MFVHSTNLIYIYITRIFDSFPLGFLSSRNESFMAIDGDGKLISVN